MIAIEHDALTGNVVIVLMPRSKNSLTDSEHGKIIAGMAGAVLIKLSQSSTFFKEKNSRHWHCFACFRRKTLAKSRSLEIIDITMRIFPAIHINTTLKFDWTIFG